MQGVAQAAYMLLGMLFLCSFMKSFCFLLFPSTPILSVLLLIVVDTVIHTFLWVH